MLINLKVNKSVSTFSLPSLFLHYLFLLKFTYNHSPDTIIVVVTKFAIVSAFFKKILDMTTRVALFPWIALYRTIWTWESFLTILTHQDLSAASRTKLSFRGIPRRNFHISCESHLEAFRDLLSIKLVLRQQMMIHLMPSWCFYVFWVLNYFYFVILLFSRLKLNRNANFDSL